MNECKPRIFGRDAWARNAEGRITGVLPTPLGPPPGWKPTREQRIEWNPGVPLEDFEEEEEEEEAAKGS